MIGNGVIRGSISAIGSACLLVMLCACEANNDPVSDSLSEADVARIEMEVSQALEGYAAAALAGDSVSLLAFWGDFEDFIHAGDGRVFGDREAWHAWMIANAADAQWCSSQPVGPGYDLGAANRGPARHRARAADGSLRTASRPSALPVGWRPKQSTPAGRSRDPRTDQPFAAGWRVRVSLELPSI